jgi:hypothetical protein
MQNKESEQNTHVTYTDAKTSRKLLTFKTGYTPTLRRTTHTYRSECTL